MILIVGAIIVTVCVFGGFMLEGGEMKVIIHATVNEMMIIVGGAAGAAVSGTNVWVRWGVMGWLRARQMPWRRGGC